MFIFTQGAESLDDRVGKAGNFAGQVEPAYSSPKRFSTSSASCSTAWAACSPAALIVILSPLAAPNIIRPMIEVPVTDCPSFSTRISQGRSEAHTSELQSLMRTSYAVFTLKQKKHPVSTITDIHY